MIIQFFSNSMIFPCMELYLVIFQVFQDFQSLWEPFDYSLSCGQGPVAQSVASLIADPEIVSSIPARPHTFVEVDHEIFSMVILLLPLIKNGCCQLQAKKCAQSTG